MEGVKFDKCAIIGYPLKAGELQPIVGPIIEYTTRFVGHVKISLPTYILMLTNDTPFHRDILSGISKNRTINGEEPLLFDEAFITEGFKRLSPPMTFEEKKQQFLKYLYNNGGRENKDFEFQSGIDCMIAYATPDEFNRILDSLNDDFLISIGREQKLSGGMILFQRVKITNSGSEEAIKGLPKMPLFGLVSQEITTGDFAIDQKINHSRLLFFNDPQTMDNMRSACEALSHVLEPIREDLKTYFTVKDVSDFFQLVNTFDIRHNKDTTKSLQHPEQLEWVFYTLLNTVNTFYKLKLKNPQT